MSDEIKKLSLPVSPGRHTIQRGICAICLQFEAIKTGELITIQYLRLLLQTVEYITCLQIIRSYVDELTGKHRGFAFLHFESTKAGVDSALFCSQSIFTMKNEHVELLGKILVSNDDFFLVINGDLFHFATASSKHYITPSVTEIFVPKASVGTVEDMGLHDYPFSLQF